MIKVKDIYEFIGEVSPYEIACQWDNCGLLVGDTEKEVRRIGVCLDATRETFNSAVRHNVDVVITHHPIIFNSQKSFTKGNLAYDFAVMGISVISAHTCLDCVNGGVNDVLCDILNIKNTCGVPSEDCKEPMARIGDVNEMSIEKFSEFVAEKLETTCRVVKGDRPVKKVAVCGGAGFDFFQNAVEMGADTYITGDLKHHEMLLGKDLGINLIAAGHYETEKPVMFLIKDKLSERFKDTEIIMLSETNPIDFIG